MNPFKTRWYKVRYEPFLPSKGDKIVFKVKGYEDPFTGFFDGVNFRSKNTVPSIFDDHDVTHWFKLPEFEDDE